MDNGANRSVTNDRTTLRDFRWIKPVDVSSTSDEADPIQCMGTGICDVTCDDGVILSMPMYFSEGVAATLISPDHVCCASNFCIEFTSHHNVAEGTGYLRLSSSSGLNSACIPLIRDNGPWYFAQVDTVLTPTFSSSPSPGNSPSEENLGSTATAHAIELPAHCKAELWHHQLGHPGMVQVQQLADCSTGLPKGKKGHPFRFCDACHDARHECSAQNKEPEPDPARGERFHMDFGFMRASSDNH